MEIKCNKCLGTTKISKDVIIDIASNVINEFDGISEYKSLRPVNKPAITVNFYNGEAEITVLLDVALGRNVQKCSETVQEKVKSNIQDMTKVMVSKVNVKIISII